jgi:hypothetical protein
MKTHTTILAAILGLTVLVSTSVSAEVDTTSFGKLQKHWKEYKKDNQDPCKNWYREGVYQGYITGWEDNDTAIKTSKNGTMGQYFHVVGKWLIAVAPLQ